MSFKYFFNLCLFFALLFISAIKSFPSSNINFPNFAQEDIDNYIEKGTDFTKETNDKYKEIIEDYIEKGTDFTKEIIEKYKEDLEKEILGKFHEIEEFFSSNESIIVNFVSDLKSDFDYFMNLKDKILNDIFEIMNFISLGKEGLEKIQNIHIELNMEKVNFDEYYEKLLEGKNALLKLYKTNKNFLVKIVCMYVLSFLLFLGIGIASTIMIKKRIFIEKINRRKRKIYEMTKINIISKYYKRENDTK